MKRINGAFLRTAFALVVGLLLVLFPQQAAEYLVITVGCCFMVPSIISLAGALARPAGTGLRFPIESIGSLLLGLWLTIMPDFFANLMTFVLGFVLIMGGVGQLASLIVSRQLMRVPLAYFIVPALILLAGLLALLNPMGARSSAFIVIGVGCLVYAIEELLTWFLFTRRRAKIRQQMEEAKAQAVAQAAAQANAQANAHASASDDGIEDAVIISED